MSVYKNIPSLALFASGTKSRPHLNIPIYNTLSMVPKSTKLGKSSNFQLYILPKYIGGL